MEDLQGNICMLKTILETCDDKMTDDTKKRVQDLIDTFKNKLEQLKNQQMEVEYYYSVSEESESEEEDDSDDDEKSDPGERYERDRKSVREEDSDDEQAYQRQLLEQWEEECRKQEQDSDVGYPEFNLADEV